MPGKGQQIERIKKPRVPKPSAIPTASTSGSDSLPLFKVKPTKPLGRPRALPRPSLPPPAWVSLPVPITLPSSLARIHIREFALRFAGILGDMRKDRLEELEYIAGMHARVYECDG